MLTVTLHEMSFQEAIPLCAQLNFIFRGVVGQGEESHRYTCFAYVKLLEMKKK